MSLKSKLRNANEKVAVLVAKQEKKLIKVSECFCFGDALIPACPVRPVYTSDLYKYWNTNPSQGGTGNSTFVLERQIDRFFFNVVIKLLYCRK